MKKYYPIIMLLVILLAAVPFALAQGPLVPDGVRGEVYYAAFPFTAELDGDLAEWADVPTVTIPLGVDLSSGDPAVTFAAAADDTHLYFSADVIDDNIISGEHGADYWNEDSVEFYLNATDDLTTRSYAPGIAQITIPALNAGLPADEVIISGVQGETANASVSMTLTATGYAVEVAVPLDNEVWTITPEHGGVLGFQVHLNGASTANRDTKLIWSLRDTSDQSYNDPSVFGRLVFFEVGQTEIPVVEVTAPATPVPVSQNALYRSSAMPIEARVIDLMSRMTLEEKIGQMTLVEKNSIRMSDIIDFSIGGLLSGGGGYPATNTPEAWAEMVNTFQEQALQTRLGIPLIYGVDSVHGHNNVYGATIFPHNIGLGAANNPDLMVKIGQVTAAETAATSIFWNYAPVLAVAQDARWGRYYESYGENTELVSTLATAYMLGLQGDDLTASDTVLATIKHFVGDGGTVWGTSTTEDYMIDQGVTDVDEATLRAIHLPPYVDAIENGAQSLMISFSSWGGMKMHAQQYLITDVLKGELGFSGFVVSDWAGIDQINPDDYYESVVTSINAGVDMNMVPYDYIRFIDTMVSAVENGDITMARIDDAVERILTVKFNMGLFEQPVGDPALLSSVGSDAHRAIAREAVSQSLVLLKNDGDVLPLASDTPTIFVAGRAADDIGMLLGGWSIEWQGATGPITIGTTILEGITAAVSPDTTVQYDIAGNFDGSITADVGIVVIGEEPYAEGRGDSDNLSLSRADRVALDNMREHCETMLVIMVSGRPLIVTDEIADWDAFVAAWLPGTEGAGVADVLFGTVPFTGKLSVSWPRSMDQFPLDTLLASDEEPLFPFGYGLTTE
jgi:beta-glucosidase